MDQRVEMSILNPKYPSCEDEFIHADCLWTSWTTQEIIKRVEEEFLFKEDDFLIAGYTKCGNTLLGEIVWILHQSSAESPEKVMEAIDRASKSTIYTRIPFLEMNYLIDFEPFAGQMYPIDFLEKHAKSPRYIKSHLPISCFEKAFKRQKKQDPNFKPPIFLLAMRNPKDTSVSMYHFYKIAEEYNYKGSWEDFFKMWIEGWIVGGDYRMIYQQWGQFIELNSSKSILPITYEDCVLNPLKVLKDLCQIFGFTIPDGDRIELILGPIVKHTRFEKMKENAMVNYTTLQGFNDSGSFMRKGKVGDWRNWYTKDQNDIFEQEYSQALINIEHSCKVELKTYTNL